MLPATDSRGAEQDSAVRANGHFATTHWSVVLAAGGGEAGHAALAALCETYWYPIYAFARRKGYRPADAQDLTQSFFAYLIEARLVEKADRSRGRFRSFLLACFINFIESQELRSRAMKRG